MQRRNLRDLGRRSFLQSIGASSLILPFLPMTNSEAGGLAFPKRLILYYFPTGTVLKNWRCTGGELDFELSPILSPLQRHRDELIILDGIDNEVISTIPQLGATQR